MPNTSTHIIPSTKKVPVYQIKQICQGQNKAKLWIIIPHLKKRIQMGEIMQIKMWKKLSVEIIYITRKKLMNQ